MSHPLVTTDDLGVPDILCGCGHVADFHPGGPHDDERGWHADWSQHLAGDRCPCRRTKDGVRLAHLDSIVRREVAKALLNLPVTLEAAVRDSGKPGVQIAARAGITPKHLSQMLTGKACRVDTWTKVLHAALTEEEER